MNVVGLCGSPKPGDSASLRLLQVTKELLGSDVQFHEVVINDTVITTEHINKCLKADVLLVSIPLYFDGIPSHFLKSMKKIEIALKNQAQKPTLYAIVNNGFIEGKQSVNALDMFRLFTHQSNINWGTGLGIGAGNMLMQMQQIPLGKGIRKNLGRALNDFVTDIKQLRTSPNRYVQPNFPRFLYIFLAHRSFIKHAKNNGLKKKALFQ